MTELEDGLEICWYIDGDDKSCAYRKQGSAWKRFLREHSSPYSEGFGAAYYDDLFGYRGFYITAPHGAVYTAHDYYYFDENDDLKLLLKGYYIDVIGDLNGDGETEMLLFYKGGMDAHYYYAIDDIFYSFDIIDALRKNFSDWTHFHADPYSIIDENGNIHSDILKVNYRIGDIDYYALISFTADAIIVSTD